MPTPKVSIISTSANNNQDPVYTYIVDPNPAKLDVFDSEDRFLYVNLQAYKKSRSILVQEEQGIDFATSEFNNAPISFISRTKQNGRDYVTTNYINVDGLESSVEGFGITSIDINQSADFVPKVKIKFFDVRGSTIKSFDLNNGVKNSNNPLATFFTYPYPVFKLTIKGFYGNPVSYCLHLVKSDYTFNSADGGFVIDAEFVGYTYAFLSHIPVKFLYSLPNTSIGRKKLEKSGAKPLSDVINDYTKLTRFVSQYKRENNDYETIRILNTILDQIKEIQIKTGFFIGEDNAILYTPRLSFNGETINNSLYIRNNGIYAIYAKDNYERFFKDIKVKINNLKETLSQNNFSFSDYNVDEIKAPATSRTLQDVINKVRNNINENEPEYDLSTLNVDSLRKRSTSFTENGVYFEVNFYDLRIWLKKLSEKLNKQKDNLSNNVTDDLNQQIQTIFNPTIDEFFRNFTANIEAFNEIVFEYAIKASAENLKGRRKEILGLNTDVKLEDEIYPFPDVIIGNEKAWLGQLKNADEEVFPEIKLINLFVNSIFDLNNRQKEIEYNNQLLIGIENENFNWLPINVLDIFNSQYNDFNFNGDITDFYKVLIQRFFVLNNLSSYINNENDIRIWANLESKYAVEVIQNKQFIELFNSSEINIQQMINQFLDENFIFDINNEYGLIEPSVSDVNFTNNNNIIIKSETPSFFDSLRAKPNNYNNILTEYINNNNIRNSITGGNNFSLTDNDIFGKRLSSKYFNDVVSGQIEEVVNLESLLPIDGESISFNINVDSSIYVNGANNYIGRNKYNTELYSIFDEPNYEDFGDDLKKFLILDTLNIKTELINILDDFSEKSAVYLISKPILLYLGSMLNISKKYFENQLSFNENTFLLSNNITISNFFDFYNDDNYSLTIKNKLIEYVENWDYKLIEDSIKTYTNSYKNDINLSENSIGFDDFVRSYNNILDFYKTEEAIAVSKPKDIVNKSKLTKLSDLEFFINEFKKEFAKKVNKLKTKKVDQEKERERMLNDDEILLEIYNDIKSYYDKWLAYGENDGKIYNVCYSDKNKTLFDHFYFIDRAWNHIGDKVVLNPKPLLKLFKNDKINCYQFIGSLLNENNFSVHFAPSHVSFQKPDDLIDMFTPQTNLNKTFSNPAVIAFYVGEMSKYLKADENYKEDGFNLNETDIPNDFSSREIADRHIDDPSPYNISSFIVNHGDTNQSHFSDIQISTTEFQNTAEYLKTQSDILDKGGAVQRFYKGLDIYDLYKYRSYSATVTSMGNMMIQPFQYFQMNVPLFKGAYLITNTSHSLTPHNHKTTFKGYKISRYVMPLVRELTSFINLSFDKSYSSGQLNVAQPEIIEDSVGFDTVDDLVDSVSASENEILRAINENGQIIRYVLDENLTQQSFEENLSRVFNGNISTMNSYGIPSGYCMKWVKTALSDVGIISVPFGGVDAWDLFAGLNSSKINYFDLSFSSEGLSVAYDYASQINQRLALVFGYFPTSKYKEVSINAIRNRGAFEKIETLSRLNRTDFDFNPITHIGIYSDGIFYDLVNGVRVNPTSSFVPIAYVNLYNDVEFLVDSVV